MKSAVRARIEQLSKRCTVSVELGDLSERDADGCTKWVSWHAELPGDAHREQLLVRTEALAAAMKTAERAARRLVAAHCRGSELVVWRRGGRDVGWVDASAVKQSLRCR